MPTIVRITTVPISLKILLKGQLKFLQQNGFNVVAISANGSEVSEVEKQEECRHISVSLSRSINPFIDIICIVKLFFILKKIRPQIVHTHTPKAGFIGMMSSRLANVPIRLHTVAGLPWTVEKGIKKKVLKFVETLTIIASTKVYVNSKNLLAYLNTEEIVSEKLCILGNGTSNGIDVNFFCNTNEIEQKAKELKQLHNVRQDDWIWLFVGRVVKDKGIEELLDAFKKFQLQFPNDQLWIVGKEEEELDPVSKYHQALMHTNKNIKRWDFQNDVRPFYVAAEVLVFPSYREGFPNVPMQAALLDCGLILSNINGCNEIVEDNKTGLLVEVKSANSVLNKMLFARENKSLINEYAKAAKTNIVKCYSQDIVWKNLLKEYKILIDKYVL